MKLFTGWVISAGLVFTAAAANAQEVAPGNSSGSPYAAVSDIGGRYAEVAPEGLPPRYYGPAYGPTLLPPTEVYTIVRESGFSPLGIPQQRGLVYRIAVIDRRGDDGRLVIDARTGRVIRFVPTYRMGESFYDDSAVVYGPGGSLPPMSNLRGPPRPPASVPHVASRAPVVPIPKASPAHAGEIAPEAKPLAAKPPVPEPAQPSAPAQQSAAVQAKPADVPSHPPAAVPIVAAKPAAAEIKPTQEMPKAQGLD